MTSSRILCVELLHVLLGNGSPDSNPLSGRFRAHVLFLGKDTFQAGCLGSDVEGTWHSHPSYSAICVIQIACVFFGHFCCDSQAGFFRMKLTVFSAALWVFFIRESVLGTD